MLKLSVDFRYLTHFASFHRAAPRGNEFKFLTKSSIFVATKPTKSNLGKLEMDYLKVQRICLRKAKNVNAFLENAAR